MMRDGSASMLCALASCSFMYSTTSFTSSSSFLHASPPFECLTMEISTEQRYGLTVAWVRLRFTNYHPPAS